MGFEQSWTARAVSGTFPLYHQRSRTCLPLVCPQCGRPAPRNDAKFCPRDGCRYEETNPDRDPLLGTLFAGRYRVLKRLGQGGTATVYLCDQQPIGRQVALKLLRPHMAGDDEMARRFLVEAKAMSRLISPHAIKVIAFDSTPEGALYLVMEFLEGRSLREHLELVERVPVDETLRILRDVGEPLAEAHAKGIVHRDLKPDNVFLVRGAGVVGSNFVKVLDFGIARAPSLAGTNLTKLGEVLGTPAYMSPEMVLGHAVDARADVFALGVMMYEMLAGERPFKANDAFQLMHALLRKEPDSIRIVAPDVEVPKPLHRLLWSCLAKDREQRPADGAAFVAELDRVVKLVADGADTERLRPLYVTGMGMCGGDAAARAMANASRGWQTLSPDLRKTALRDEGSARPKPATSAPAASVDEFPPTAEVAMIRPRDAADTAPRGAPDELDEVSAAFDSARRTRVRWMAGLSAAFVLGLVLLAVLFVSSRSTVGLTLTSEPAGARVHRGGQDLGATPLVLRVPQGGVAVAYSFSLAGYADATVSVLPDETRQVHVPLTPAAPVPKSGP